MKRIILIDDHPIMRHGLAQLIGMEPGLEVIGQAGSAVEGMQLLDKVKADLAIVDLTLPDRHGLELIKDIQALHPSTRTIVLSMHEENLYAERALRAGARGYVMKETAADTLVSAIKKVLGGGIYVSDAMASRLMEQATGQRGRAGSAGIDKLTDRELEVMQLIGQGKASKHIAELLNISARTVEAHRAHLKDKLGLPDGAALVRYAVQWVENHQRS